MMERLDQPIPINVNGRDGFVTEFDDITGDGLVEFNDGTSIILDGDTEAVLVKRKLQ